MSEIFKNPTIRMYLVIAFTVLTLFEGFFKFTLYTNLVNAFLKWILLIAAFTLILGAGNVGFLHGNHIMKRTKDQWYLSIWLLIMVILTTFLGISTEMGVSSLTIIYDYLIVNIFTPVTSAAFSLLAFYFVSIVFRAFRGRNSYVIIFLLCGVILMLANTPALQPIQELTGMGSWLLTVPNMGATRGMVISAAIGVLLIALRTITGNERGAVREG